MRQTCKIFLDPPPYQSDISTKYVKIITVKTLFS